AAGRPPRRGRRRPGANPRGSWRAPADRPAPRAWFPSRVTRGSADCGACTELSHSWSRGPASRKQHRRTWGPDSRGPMERQCRREVGDLPLRLEGLVDHLLEALDGAVGDTLPGDEEGRCALDVRGPTVRHVLLDLLLDLGSVEVFLPAGAVEPDLPGVLLQLIVTELPVVLEDDVVHLPELSLLPRRSGGFGSRHRVGVHGGREGELLVDEVHVGRVRLQHLVDQTGRLRAERSLE